MARLPDPQDDTDRKLLEDVDQHGWHIIRVPGSDEVPSWAFSIGVFHTFGHPEIVVFGLPLENLHQIINSIGRAIRQGGSFPPDSQSDDVLEGRSCLFRAVHEAWYKPFLGYAIWFYQGTSFPAVQCLWPDRYGRFPGEPQYDPDLANLQPLLWEPDPASARTEATLRALGP